MQISLTDHERLCYEYHKYAYDGIKINLEQSSRGVYEYDGEMRERLIDAVTEKYASLQKVKNDILKAHGLNGYKIQRYDDGILYLGTG
jgi:hypothetical protein